VGEKRDRRIGVAEFDRCLIFAVSVATRVGIFDSAEVRSQCGVY
jgi:hypothetical protein